MYQILHEKTDISNITSKSSKYCISLTPVRARLQAISLTMDNSLYSYLDNSIVNVFDRAMLHVAPNCRTKNMIMITSH